MDGKFHLVELKKKNQKIRDEINKLTSEVEEINKDNQTYLTLERKWDTLIKEVRGLEGELADRNLAQDKQRSGTKPDDIEAHFYHIKNQNDKQKQVLDRLFGEKRDMESEI
jgi:predicted nuclease with TOPRIM domain